MRFIHNHLLALFVALALMAAAASWYGTAPPIAPKFTPPATEVWSLPKLAEFEAKKSLDVISARNLWGAVAGPVVKEPEWRIMGMANNGTERFVLLAFEGKPIEMLKVGDALPGGLKIAKIDNDRFFVITPDKKEIAFGMYKNEPAK